MRRVLSWAALAGVLGTAACVAPQSGGPGVTAMPGDGKSFEAFQSDDQRCRQAAAQANGFIGPAQAANQGAATSMVLGTAAGAGAGAMVGSSLAAVGTGALIGGGVGMVAGTLIAAGVAQESAQSNQHHYDTTYVQCMAAAGERVPDLAAGNGPGYAYGGAPVAAAAPTPVAATPLAPPLPSDDPPVQPQAQAYAPRPLPPLAPPGYAPPQGYAPPPYPPQAYAQAYYPPPPYYGPGYYAGYYGPEVVVGPGGGYGGYRGYWGSGWRRRYW